MRTSILMGLMTTLAMSTLAASMVVVAATTGPLNLLSAYADTVEKEKVWGSEGGVFRGICDKDSEECGTLNQRTREACEEETGAEHCKQFHQ